MAGIVEGVEVDIVEELPVRATMLQSKGNTSTNGFEVVLVHTFKYLTKKKTSQAKRKRRKTEECSKAHHLILPSLSLFSLRVYIYIYKYTQGSAKGNVDGCAPDNVVITPSITNATFLSFPLWLPSFLIFFTNCQGEAKGK